MYVNLSSPGAIRFFVIVVLSFFTSYHRRAITFANFVLSTAFIDSGFLYLKSFEGLPAFRRLLPFPIPGVANGNDGGARCSGACGGVPRGG